MRLLRFVLAFLLATDACANAADQIPPAVLAKVKAATVFIKVKTASETEYGSGFLIKYGKDQYFVITNHYVIAPVQFTILGPTSKVSKSTQIEVVFASGDKSERTFKAEAVADNPVENLAALKLKDAKDLPEALNHMEDVAITETLPLCILGFPFGRELVGGKRNPNITVSRGAVSSIRRTLRDIDIFQIDAELNPGQNGAPIVDMQGRLIGVACVGLDGTKIGFAVPAVEIDKLFDPCLGKMTLAADQLANGALPVKCTVELVDPLPRVSKVELRYAPAEGQKPILKSNRDVTYPEMPNSVNVELKVQGDKATGSFRIPKPDKPTEKYRAQLVVTYADKSIGRSEDFAVTLKPARTETVSAEARRMMNEGGPSSLVVKPRLLVPSKPPQVVAEIEVEGSPAASNRSVPANSLCWSNDGKSFYHIGGNGVVRRLSGPSLKEEANQQTDLRYSMSIASAANGIVIAGATSAQAQNKWVNQIVLADSGTLEPIHILTESQFRYSQIVAAPSSSFAYGCLHGRKKELVVIDLAKGEIVKRHDLADLTFPEPGFDSMAISPDGKWLVSRDSQRLYRFALNGVDVKFEESSPKILYSSSPEVVKISADSKWIRAFVDNDHFVNTRDGRQGWGTHLFAMESLAKPAHTIHGVNHMASCNFDRAKGQVYFASGVGLDVYTPQGEYVGSHVTNDCLKPQLRGRELLVHPEGKYIAMLMSGPDASKSHIVLIEVSEPCPISDARRWNR